MTAPNLTLSLNMPGYQVGDTAYLDAKASDPDTRKVTETITVVDQGVPGTGQADLQFTDQITFDPVPGWTVVSSNEPTYRRYSARCDVAGLVIATVTVRDGQGNAITKTISAPVTAAPAAQLAFKGFQPGKIYVGLAGDSFAHLTSRETIIGRQGGWRDYAHWGNEAAEDAAIKSCHSGGRLPFVNIAAGDLPSLAAIANGDYHDVLMRRGTRYAGYPKPVGVTFAGEPERRGWAPAAFEDAFCVVADTLREAGCWSNIAFGACLMDWTWDPNSGLRPADWLSQAMIARSHCVVIDSYDPWGLKKTAPRKPLATVMGPVLAWLRNNAPQLPVIIGETGTSHDPNNPSYQANWINAAWAWLKGQAVVAQSPIAGALYFDFAPSSTSDTTFDAAGLTAWKAITADPIVATLAKAGL